MRLPGGGYQPDRSDSPLGEPPNQGSGGVSPRRRYAQRADALADLINKIAELRSNPLHFHETRDAAAREARAMARSLRGDGL